MEEQRVKVLLLSDCPALGSFKQFDKNLDNQWVLERLFLDKGKCS